MRWRKQWAVPILCGSCMLPMMIGCDAGDQQVRDDVVDVETFEGEKLKVRDDEVTDDVNIDVRPGY